MSNTEETIESTPDNVEVGGESAQAVPAAEGSPSPEPTLDWSFKFNEEVKQVPEEYRWVKAPEQVEKLKDIYQRAEAVNYHKEQTGVLKNQVQGYQTQLSEYEPIVTQVRQLQDWYGKGDHERVLQSLGYDKEKILDLARSLISRDQMPPEQKALYEEKRAKELEIERYARENEMYRQETARQITSLTSMQLESEFSRPEVQQVAQAYDANHGAGKFREFVIGQGEAMVARLGRHVPPSELVPLVVNQFKPFVGGNFAGATPTQQTSGEGSQAAKPKVIPNVKGNSASVGGKQFTSIADLKKHRQQIGG